MKPLTLTLPFPVSTNQYWRAPPGRVRNRVLVSSKGRKFKHQVATTVKILAMAEPLPDFTNQRLHVDVDLYPPDRRWRDGDNYAGKSLFDALQAAGVIEDDSNRVIQSAAWRWHEASTDPRCVVTITPIT